MSKPRIIYVCALYCEAAPIIEKLQLKKRAELTAFQVFEGSDAFLIITGIGKVNSAAAVSYITGVLGAGDYYFNIGVCGSISSYKISEFVVPHKIVDLSAGRCFFPELKLKGDLQEGVLGTFDLAVSDEIPGIDFYDMEASGFFEAASKFADTSRVYSLKVISDTLTERKLNKEIISKLILDNLPHIFGFIETLLGLEIKKSNNFITEEEALLSLIEQKFELTVSQKIIFRDSAKGFKVRGGKIQGLKKFSLFTPSSKLERNEHFNAIKEFLLTI
ncbi:MAG: hypothetical protein SGJ02_10550 [bacterium]|nr:hypothetical protein [bacterium]